MIHKVLLLFTLWGATLFAGEIYVYAPTLTKSNVIEKEMGAHLQKASVRAFGRYSDFKAMVKTAPPAAVIAPLATLRELGLMGKVKLQGLVGGQSSQPLVLVSLDQALAPSSLTGVSVGLVSIMDRPALKRYLEARIPAKPKANPTTKLEDLLPLLTFQSAQAILVTDAQARQIRARSQANLVVQPLSGASQDCLALVILDEKAMALVAEVEKLPKVVLELLDLEGWKK